MKTKFNFNSQICTTREQSERLLALGLKKETSDCYYWQETEPMHGEAVGIWHLETLDSKDNQEHFKYLDKNFGVCLADDEEHYFIPAWSLGRLIEMMPLDAFPEGGFDNSFTLVKSYPRGYNVEYDGFSFYHKENIYDTLIEAIEHLIKEGYFNKEYLVWKRKAKFRK